MNDPDLPNVLIPPDTSIADAMEVLNDAHRRIVIVVDVDRRVLGVVTDSNLRRAMLARVDFINPIESIMTRSPIVVTPEMTSQQVLNLMERTHCHEVPVVDHTGVIVDLLLIEDLLRKDGPRYPQRTAIIMAGGLGERLRPITETVPKPLLEVGGKPILFSILDQLLASDFDKIFISVNYLADKIEEAVGSISAYARNVEFVREIERMGTGGALTLLPVRPTEPVLVLNGDLLTNIDFSSMLRFHDHEQNAATIALREEKVQIPYGVAQLEGTRVLSMREKPEYTHFVNTGIYVISPQMIDYLEPGQHADMPELVTRIIENEHRVGCFPVHEYWMDIGQPSQLEQADSDYGRVFKNPKSSDANSDR